MSTFTFRSFSLAVAVVAVGWFGLGDAAAPAAELQGPEVCKDCHQAEYEIWEKSPHAESFRTVHRSDKAGKILEAFGERSMKQADACIQCHYTVAPRRPGGRARPSAGPSCESCHGASSEWIKVHNVFGPKGTKREEETAEHKQQRFEEARAAGMIWPTMRYDAAANCFNCHGMARESLDAETAAKLMDGGHPLKPDFELVRYSQGTIRHRFYPPDLTKNQEMTPVERARWFVTGQAASLVQANRALEISDHERYVAAQTERAEKAKEVLAAIQGTVPEAGALLADISEANARALVDAIADVDLTPEVGGMLPSPDAYK